MLWDPYVTMSLPLQCVECTQPITRNAWKVGQSGGLLPRVIHDIHSVVILVSCQYKCSKSHSILTTDPRVLALISDEHIPFILLHKVGFTKIFARQVIGLLEEGMSISSIERFIQRQRHLFTCEIAAQVMQKLSLTDDDHLTHYSSLMLLGTPYPSNYLIYKCFLTDFLLNSDRYMSVMSTVSANNVISIDHTFKIASNIGYLRGDGKWITQYKSVFIVMNEKGQVMAWQFVRTVTMDEVQDLLRGVKNRVQDVSSLMVLLDNCCSMRGKLIDVFGPNIIIKLDLFHAVQWISAKIPKRHPYFHLCISDLRLVFRQPIDLGYVRKLDTPSSDIILQNLEKFTRKWEPTDSNGWKIINSKVLKEIECLRVHVHRGCLSNIPPGVGTNRNERLHRHIRPHFTHTRLGLPLALALMTLLLHQHNSRIIEKCTGQCVKPIYFEPKPVTPEQFGITDKHKHQQLWGVQNLQKLSLSCADLDSIASTVTLNNEVADIICIEEVVRILETAVHLYNSTKSMSEKCGSSSVMNYRFLPLMSSVSSIFFSTVEMPADIASTELDNLIASWNMKRVSVVGDGNCCFVSVAHGLISTKFAIPLQVIHTRLTLNTTLSLELREITVREWQDNTEYYSGFLADCDILSEAEKFYNQDILIPILVTQFY